MGTRGAQIQDAAGLRFLDFARIECIPEPTRRSDSKFRPARSTAVHPRFAGRLARHVQKLGRFRCAHAPRAVGIAGWRQVREWDRTYRSRSNEPWRLRTTRDLDGAAPRRLVGSSRGAVVDESRVSTEIAMQRRRFLLNVGALAASAAIPNALFAHTGGNSRLIVVILRGALDGLAAVPPHGDPAYAGLRRELAIAPPGSTDGALALTDIFGLHPSLAYLHERFAARELLVFDAVASPYRDRSH